MVQVQQVVAGIERNYQLAVANESSLQASVNVSKSEIQDISRKEFRLRELQRELGLSVIFVTHDIGAAVEVADRIAVMYAGRIVEEGAAATLLRAPRHPYTLALLKSRASGALAKGTRLETIAGSPPDLTALPTGCAFADRCRMVQDACKTTRPEISWLAAGHSVRCLRVDETAA